MPGDRELVITVLHVEDGLPGRKERRRICPRRRDDENAAETGLNRRNVHRKLSPSRHSISHCKVAARTAGKAEELQVVNCA